MIIPHCLFLEGCLKVRNWRNYFTHPPTPSLLFPLSSNPSHFFYSPPTPLFEEERGAPACYEVWNFILIAELLRTWVTVFQRKSSAYKTAESCSPLFALKAERGVRGVSNETCREGPGGVKEVLSGSEFVQ